MVARVRWAIGLYAVRYSDFCPRPKKSSFVCCDKNPEPAWRDFVWRSGPASTVTAAPMASRLLLLPCRRNGDRIADAIHRQIEEF